MEIDQEEALRAARAAAWPIPAECAACGGSGVDSERIQRRVVHTFRGTFGADWDLDQVEKFLAEADTIEWVDNLFDHNLVATVDGRRVAFQVQRP
jgi:hypothetical protein